MAQTIFAWLVIVAVSAAGYPWAAWLLAHSPRRDSAWLTILVGFALSVGCLTLLMLWEALGGVAFSFWAITLPYMLLMTPGWVLWYRRPDASERSAAPNGPHWAQRVASLIILGVAVSILFNALYWPFSRDDARRIYDRYGNLMWRTGALIPFAGRDDAFYQAYPVLIPMTITYTYLASGWKNEYLARLIPALLSLGCLPAVYLLGRLLNNRLAGWLAALLLALTPAFGNWASAGYVDLPMAFFYLLSGIFAWRLWLTQHWMDALLAGVMMGLAAWTKNAALLGIALLGVWLCWARVNRRIEWRLLLLAILFCALIGAPWYLRNMAEAGILVPPTAWIDQARPSLDNLLVFVTHPEIFGLSGWAISLGLATVGLELAQHGRKADGQILLALWIAPFFLTWWLLLSYDSRFLLLILPVLTVVAGISGAHLWVWLPQPWQKRLLVLLTVLAVASAVDSAWNSVEFKSDILGNPLMNHDEKLAVVRKDR